MANCKEVTITGIVPFNTNEHEALQRMLGQMNAPAFGYRISYTGSAPPVKSEGGGQTAMYRFVIEGMEAVSDYWFAHLVRAIRNAGGKVEKFQGYDTGFDCKFGLAAVEATLVDLVKYEARNGGPRLTSKEIVAIAQEALKMPDGDVWANALIEIEKRAS